jgi:6-phosphofructokinase 1
MNTVVEIVDKLRDTCESHARCNVVEVMGRGAGDIALNTAIASGASAVVVPEFPYSTEEICAKIKKSRALGKRNFIVIVSEGVGSEYAPALAKTIQETTGVETKFARLAHIVRGGNPTLRDRVLASKMGVYAAEELLRGNSNLVVCEKAGKLISTEIKYALALDKLYKKTLKEGEIDAFSPEQVADMNAAIAKKIEKLTELYTVGNTINL